MSQQFSRRLFMKSAGLFLLPLNLSARMISHSKPQELLLYVGTYTSGKSEGIYLYRMDLSTGELSHVSTARGVVNPSFLAIDRHRRNLYAVNEVTEFSGQPSGAVSAFSINQKTGDLTLLNQQPSRGGAPCYLWIDKTGRFVLLANYVGGNAAVLPVERDGTLGMATDVAQHRGASVNPERQEGPHTHCIVLDRSNRYAFAADLGIDRIMIYRFDAKRGKLIPGKEPSIALKPGAGPRHFTFHPNDLYAYVINELDSTLTAFSYDAERGTLSAMQTVPTLPDSFSGLNYCADVHVSPSGKFLYGSNRGHDSIVVFAIDARTGMLRYVQNQPTGGKFPRNFVIDPTGTWLLVANQHSDTIVTFRISSSGGSLTPTGHLAEVPSPVCLKLIPTFS
jgi:6-phosphogluconolactonase